MASIMSPNLKALSLSLCVLLTTYTNYLTGTPPNPTPYNSTNPDSMSRLVSPTGLFIRRFFNVSLGVYHAYLCLSYPSPSPLICPHSSQLAPYLFTWTRYSAVCIAVNLLGCYIRLSAFSALGPNFTFRLAKPTKLVTSGLYNYVQHPSYIGKLLIVVANAALLHVPSGPVACWLPAWMVEARLLWRALVCVGALAVNRVTWKRVKQEEKMLKDAFGKEWEDWHARTKRFVPGLF